MSERWTWDKALEGSLEAVTALSGPEHTRNPRVIKTLLGPAFRGLVLRAGKTHDLTRSPAAHAAVFDWTYARTSPTIERLTHAGRRNQWIPDDVLDWSTDIDPENPAREILPEELSPLGDIKQYHSLGDAEKRHQRFALGGWLLSQFLHGEQGALFAACQITESVEGTDLKLYGASQVADEGRHVDVFDRYLTKMEKRYPVNDNLFVILDALMRDSRWDLKFLGMQILVEGLALGAFGVLRQSTREPLLRELLGWVMKDEARHVHFGVEALEPPYRAMPPGQRREREDWAYEMCVLLRNRFLAHEFYEEFYEGILSRDQWNNVVLQSEFMARFRRLMFRRIVPNLKRIHLLPDRVRPYYEQLGILMHEVAPAAPDLDVAVLLAEGA